MPVDLCASLDRTSNWAFGSSILNGLFGNKIVVSVIIALIMVLIVMLVYPAKKGTGVGSLIKMFIYMGALACLIMFVHDGVLKASFEEEHKDTNSIDISESAHRDIVYPNRITIKPNVTESPLAPNQQFVTGSGTSTQQPAPQQPPPVQPPPAPQPQPAPVTGSGDKSPWYKTKHSGHHMPFNRLK